MTRNSIVGVVVIVGACAALAVHLVVDGSPLEALPVGASQTLALTSALLGVVASARVGMRLLRQAWPALTRFSPNVRAALAALVVLVYPGSVLAIAALFWSTPGYSHGLAGATLGIAATMVTAGLAWARANTNAASAAIAQRSLAGTGLAIIASAAFATVWIMDYTTAPR